MVFSSHRVLILLLCIGLLAVRLNKADGARNIDLVQKNERILKDVAMKGMNAEKKSAPANKKFDPNESSKRRKGTARGDKQLLVTYTAWNNQYLLSQGSFTRRAVSHLCAVSRDHNQ
ncbi:hypothetical protein ACFE04_024209 [Oxalis oulophora]